MTRRKQKPFRPHGKPVKHGVRIATTAQRSHLTVLHRNGELDELCSTARSLLKDCPDDAFVWTALGSSLLKKQHYEEALKALETADKLFPGDPQILDGLAKTHAQLGNHQQAIARQQRSLEVDPDNAAGHFHLASLLHECGDIKALEHVDKAEALGHDIGETLSLRGFINSSKFKFNETLQSVRKLIEVVPNSPEALTNLGNTYKDLGMFQESEEAYLKALEIRPQHMPAYSNMFFSMHYDPARSAEEILEFAKGWEERFPPSKTIEHPTPERAMAARPVRVGLLSGGFCAHPVGQMIAVALENTDDSLEVYAYSTNQMHDHITERIVKCVDSWQTVGHLNEEQLADKIHQDAIDILIDLNGHGAGNRMKSIAMRPAPLIVKWVGGLVGSMGLSSFDYLISDSIETPPGVDHLYVEKLIRMPDDYICYLPSEAITPITMLPAATNGYVTLGCFNNPAKINPILLGEWAKLMHQLPNCRLLLKGAQYDSPEFCERIRDIMREHDISDERIILEGPSKHQELLQAYNRVDIALDPWPYSGGLTTCEAMLMGVPVVTLPGPTFAGRHSATHLVNAGMPELVVDSWDQYRQRVIELATDLPNLSVIRACLRRVLMESPVCDGPRFARHFTTAMRAIWQRYCQGKAPAALTLDKDGSVRFEGETETVELVALAQTPAKTVSDDSTFQWDIEGKIITFDHGAVLTADPIFTDLQKLSTFATITFDPAGKVTNAEHLQQNGELHHYPHVALGDGKPLTLYSCAGPAMTTTLEPLPAVNQLLGDEQKSQVIDCHTIPSLRMDDIEGLDNIDWILLDDLNDSLTILEHAHKTIANTLLIHARVSFTPKHQKQPDFGQLTHWLTAHGFRFYRLNNQQNLSYLPKRNDLLKQQATQLISADALFLPNTERMASININQRLKLAFILHHAYGVNDLSYQIIYSFDTEKATNYLRLHGYLENSAKINIKNQKNALLFYPDYTHANPYQKLLYKIFPKDIFISPGLPWELEKNPIETKIFHLHWEDIIYREARNEKEAIDLIDEFVKKIKSAKTDGWKLLWTIHNSAPHENIFPSADRHIRLLLSELADLAIVHSDPARKILEADLPDLNKKIRVLPHGNYKEIYPKNTTREEARKKLDIKTKTTAILFFGNIRDYKGIDDLLIAFSAPEIQKTDSVLIIAGQGPIEEHLKKYYTGSKEKLKISNRHINDNEVQDFFVAADFCAYPFKKILTSGSVILGYSFSKPVIIPESNSLQDFSKEGAISYSASKNGSLKAALLSCCTMKKSKKIALEKQAAHMQEKLNWTNFSKIAEEITKELSAEKESPLTILVFGKSSKNIETWIINHKNTRIAQHNIVFAFHEGDRNKIEKHLSEFRSASISPANVEGPNARIALAVDSIKTEFTLLCASDDKIENIPEISKLKEEFSEDGVIGLSGKIIFHYPDGTIAPAITNRIELFDKNDKVRLKNYWTPPFPADNSVFLSIFKTETLRKAINMPKSRDFEAWDWVAMTALLTNGSLKKTDLTFRRGKTPHLNYTKSYIERNNNKEIKNPLTDALEELKNMLSREQMEYVSPGFEKWLKTKEIELNLIIENKKSNQQDENPVKIQ